MVFPSHDPKSNQVEGVLSSHPAQAGDTYRPAIGMPDVFRQRPAMFDAQEYRFYNYIPDALANTIHDEINSFFNYYDAGGGSAPAEDQT